MLIDVPETGVYVIMPRGDPRSVPSACFRTTSGTSYQARSTSMELPSFPCAKLKLDQFFLQWLSDHQDTVRNPILELVVVA